MTGAEIDAIKEADDSRIWEEMNAETVDTRAAVDLLTQAVALLEQVEQLVTDAAEVLDGKPDASRVESLNIDAEDLECAVRAQIERMG